jgi:hypothetical protein
VAKFVPCGVHLPENKFQSLVGIDNIECATLERFYEILFQKNTEPFLFEFLIVRIRFIADGESDGHISGVVRYAPLRSRIPAPRVAPSAAFAAFRRAAAFFVTVSMIVKPPSIRWRPPNNSVPVRAP